MPTEEFSNTGAVTDRPIDVERLRAAVVEILEAIGEDPQREGLLRTPERVANMYAEVFAGLREDPDHHLEVQFEAEHDEMVMVRDIPFYSMCEHHLLPFVGKAHVAYVPGDAGKITGLSKLARLVEAYARRPQEKRTCLNECCRVELLLSLKEFVGLRIARIKIPFFIVT